MRHILQGFTMYVDGVDFGIDTEEVELPIPTPMTQEYRGGGQDLGATLPMAAIEALEITVKMAGHNVEVMKKMALAPGQTTRITFRGAVMREQDGGIAAHVCIVEGAINGGTRDRWQRGEKSGIEFVVNGVKYFRYEADTDVIHELQVWPPKRIVNGVNQLSEVNAALGYAS
ncbi:putative Contractile tube protein [Pseudorhizobium banfieldiae]|uniref:Putative Contractile tube protein n=1 Tax=Pseudorhizobium banfieldiae TaxID=1125847 RepID=L0NE85_9HYPH|nr:phage major tail tube protein [Pseudorhizobium banfieldiae]CAD6606276.1 phage tail protein [arsenite-oxidising bacterium NT-25]CCF19174.1 putative Contractile tube protein [Pseudorhizobium banfieldiae]